MEILKLYFWEDFLGIKDVYLRAFLGFFLAFVITYKLIPLIIKISYRKRLVANPVNRSSHTNSTPNLGGVAIFIAISIAASIFSYELFERYKLLFACLVILFFVGLIDDLLTILAKNKLYIQIIGSLMIIIGSDVRIESLFGLFWIYEVPYILSVVLTLFSFLFIINAYNLIDGIDGLAASIGIVIFSSFSYAYLVLNDFPMVILSLVCMGSLLAFLRFNISKRQKIFMGDTGSMLIGFIISFLAIRFLVIANAEYVRLPNAPVILFAILFVLILDSVSVILIRLFAGHSPFKADRNHLHHKLLEWGLGHTISTLVLIVFQIVCIGIVYLLRHLNIHLVLLILFLLGLLFLFLLKYLKRCKTEKKL